MDDERFWLLIAASRVGSPREQPRRLEDLLARLSADEIQDFDWKFGGFHARLYHWDLWAASWLLGSRGDDSFHYFRTWVVAQGRSVYERALADPDSLVEVGVFGEVEAELVMYAAAKAWERVTGRHDYVEVWLATRGPDRRQPDQPRGVEWREGDTDDLARRCPRLHEQYVRVRRRGSRERRAR